jgi:NAD(P)-dependent dehydrogenase (short-subunit alcohol dehydrogenase family)
MLLKDKRILVTGGSSGLGQWLCQTFASEGAWVAFNYSANREGAQATCEKIKSFASPCLEFQASILDSSALQKMVADIESQWQRIDILVNNAGMSQMMPMALMEEEDWDQVMAVNVKGVYLITRAVLRGMVRRKSGKILNIGSLAGLRIIESPVHYATSKAAIKGFTEALAKEMSRYNITVNTLAPGILAGGIGNNIPSYRIADYISHCAIKRLGTFAEVSQMAAFLISDDNSYMNGATLVMDGGL